MDGNSKKLPEFKTIRQTAATGLISEFYLRKLVKENKCPCIRSGNRVLVNVTALIEQLDRMSKTQMNHTNESKED